MIIKNNERCYTIKEVGVYLNIREDGINHRIRKGMYPNCFKVKSVWHIPESSISFQLTEIELKKLRLIG
jgi:hypothetical protein